MIYSMTGYGKAEYQDDKISVKVEIRSVNSKNFDFKLRIPKDLNSREIEIRNITQKALSRGKIDCSINIEYLEGGRFEINQNVALRYFDSLKQLAVKTGYKIKKIDALSVIMRLPDVLKTEEHEADEEVWQKVLQTLLKAIEQLNEFRKQEGIALSKALLSYVDNIEAALEKVPKYEGERIEKVRQRISAALKDVAENYDKDRFEQEMIYYLEKYDITEEKVRLKNHLDYFRQTIDKGGVVGKTLGFISQEMGREINTLGSKANHFAIQQLVVEMKDELEKIKEQSLNVL